MYYTEEISMKKAEGLLIKCGLSVPEGVEYTAGVFDDVYGLAATGSLKGDMIQGIAVDPAKQGEDLMGKLNERQQTILRLRFGMEDGVCHSLEKIAEIIGVSKERVRQIEKQAITRLNKLGGELGLEAFLG